MPDKIYQLENAQQFVNMLTPAGEPFVFYKGLLKTSDPELQAHLATIKNVKDVTAAKPPVVVEEVPQRNRTRGLQKMGMTPLMTPAELLQRAITSSAQTPQAAASNS